jgi:hypothetical protein
VGWVSYKDLYVLHTINYFIFLILDPEELLNSLLSQTLKASPFLELSSGQNAHLYQLFVERDETKSLPSVQELFEQSFLTSGVKLKRVPSVLILQMPRFGRQFKVYDRILPSQILDVTDVIEDGKKLFTKLIVILNSSHLHDLSPIPKSKNEKIGRHRGTYL